MDIVFPVSCLHCGKRGLLLCPECLSLCPAAERESAKWIFPLLDYRHPPVKKALWLLKYKGKKGVAKIFAELLYGQILEELSELSLLENFREPLLMPIPLSRKRRNERGYNQAELICKEIVKIHLSPSPSPWQGEGGQGPGEVWTLETNILIKPKETEHQARIKDRGIRLKNIIGSFAVKNSRENTNRIKDRNIILIDDITTTGATLNEARKILKAAGARKIIAFTVAH